MGRARVLVTVLCLAAAAFVPSTGGMASAASAASPASPASARAAGTALPAHVFAPYFETYQSSDLAAQSAASGAKYLTLAFLESTGKTSCTLAWNGDPSTPVAWSTYGADIAAIRAAGGDVIPSFGGYSADHGGTDIADSCTSVPAIAAAYEQVVTTYGVTRLDLDVEDRALDRPHAIARRNAAIALVQAWAAAQGRTVEFAYTLPVGMAGLDPTSVALLADAQAHGAVVRVVDLMTFDYYDGATHEMARDTRTSAVAAVAQLRTVYPGVPDAQLWQRIGITEMVGIDDFGPAETLTLTDARVVERWAAGRQIAVLSFWALQRDNGGCPGTAGSDVCSGVVQQRWAFSHRMEAFTA